MRAVRILGGVLLGLFGLVVSLYLVGLAINWNDQPRSQETGNFQRLLATRPAVPDADNAFVYTLGFAAPEGQDPGELGARRKAWLENFTPRTRIESDPLPGSASLRSRASESIDTLLNECRNQDRQECAKLFQQLAGKWQPGAADALALHRYRTLLGYGQSREVIPLQPSAPIPGYGDISYGHHLHLLTLMRSAQQGDFQAVNAGLVADSAYWRASKRDAQILISQMIAVAGLRNHFFFGSLVLRALPAEQVASAMPPNWQREFSVEERSMWLVMAGELAFSRHLLSGLDVGSSPIVPDEQWTWFDRVSVPVIRPFLKPQATENRVAKRFAFFCAQFDRPMSQYPEAERAVRDATLRAEGWFSVYNPVGAFLDQLTATDTFIGYAYRSASPEGMRRAALLTAQLRARGVTIADAAKEVANAGLRDPYSGSPFAWDAARQSIVFTGPGEHQWRRHEYFY